MELGMRTSRRIDFDLPVAGDRFVLIDGRRPNANASNDGTSMMRGRRVVELQVPLKAMIISFRFHYGPAAAK
jgi:hypothetical protein